MARSSWLTIVAISLVVGALSVTRMQIYAVHANERDAVRLLDQLGGALERDDSGSAPALADLSVGLLHPEESSSWSSDATRLRRHGYLFELIQLGGEPRVLAWPSEHAVTGRAAYQWSPTDGVRGHPNRDGAWSGPSGPPARLDGADWIPVDRVR